MVHHGAGGLANPDLTLDRVPVDKLPGRDPEAVEVPPVRLAHDLRLFGKGRRQLQAFLAPQDGEPEDLAGNVMTTTSATESGTADRDF